MTDIGNPEPRGMLSALDPRRSVAAAAMWLIIALAVAFSIAAAVWVGSIARENVLGQHIRRLALETDQLSSDLGQALSARIDAVRAAGPMQRAKSVPAPGGALPPGELGSVFAELTSAYAQLDWIAVADSNGVVVASNGTLLHTADRVNASPWFSSGLTGIWLGVIGEDSGLQTSTAGNVTAFGDMALPVRDDTGEVAGVIVARVSWRRAAHHPVRLTDESGLRDATEAYILDRDDVILVGPQNQRHKRWSGIAVDDGPAAAADTPRFERFADGRRVLVSRSPLSTTNEIASLGWQVQLSEPNERVYQRANALTLRILWVAIFLGATTAFLGILGARRLTASLTRLTQSVASIGQDQAAQIEVPPGVDEVAQLGRAFARILGDLQQERSELERRVAVRTREVEQLAEESRYAAIVRERLQIARDLHDTLAHSMMAMLSEIRLLRKLEKRDPTAVAGELARAERVAHEGLQEARNAITQMRVTAVRETGLGPALANAFERFTDHTGLSGEFSADAEAARFGDERAVTILRMAQEALRNVERHAQATRVTMRLTSYDSRLELRVEDNGMGFDPDAPLPGHYGVVGLREQAELIGAELRIDSRRNEGTAVCVSLRLSPIAFKRTDESNT